jgi:hypothetical protein
MILLTFLRLACRNLSDLSTSPSLSISASALPTGSNFFFSVTCSTSSAAFLNAFGAGYPLSPFLAGDSPLFLLAWMLSYRPFFPSFISSSCGIVLPSLSF